MEYEGTSRNPVPTPSAKSVSVPCTPRARDPGKKSQYRLDQREKDRGLTPWEVLVEGLGISARVANGLYLDAGSTQSWL